MFPRSVATLAYRKVMFALNCCQSIYFKVDLSSRFIMSTSTEERTGSQNALVRAALSSFSPADVGSKSNTLERWKNQLPKQSLERPKIIFLISRFQHIYLWLSRRISKETLPDFGTRTNSKRGRAKHCADLPCGHANWMTSQNKSR